MTEDIVISDMKGVFNCNTRRIRSLDPPFEA